MGNNCTTDCLACASHCPITYERLLYLYNNYLNFSITMNTEDSTRLFNLYFKRVNNLVVCCRCGRSIHDHSEGQRPRRLSECAMTRERLVRLRDNYLNVCLSDSINFDSSYFTTYFTRSDDGVIRCKCGELIEAHRSVSHSEDGGADEDKQ